MSGPGRLGGSPSRTCTTDCPGNIVRWPLGGSWAPAGCGRTESATCPTHAPPLRPAKGVHLCFRRADVAVNRAVVIPSVHGDGRRVFLVPWGEQVYLGTTDELDHDVDGPPTVTDSDAGYLLDALNAAFGSDLTVADAVDVVVAGDGLRRRSPTTRVPLGATGRAVDGVARTRRALAAAGGDQPHAGSLYHRHGDGAGEVVAACAGNDDLDPLVPGLPYLVGEVRWAVRHEMACTLDDLLSRRLRVSLRDAAAGGPAIARAAGIMADELGWDAATIRAQVDAYRDGVATERGVVPLR